MKRKDIVILVVIGIIAAIISSVIAGAIFKSNSGATKVPVVQPLSSTFPDIKNDSQYQAFFNDKALDPTQLIKIGTSNNQQPFNNGQ